MNILAGLGKVGMFGAGKTASASWKMATSGSFGRAALGGLLGTAYGTATSELSGGAALGEGLKFGVFGAAAGGMLSHVPRVARSLGRGLISKPSRNLGKSLFKGATKTGKFAGKFTLKHPVLTASVVGALGVGGATMFSGTNSPTLAGANVNMDYNKQAIAIQNATSGIAPMSLHETGQQKEHRSMMQQMADRKMKNSTIGLVQGLNQGRHG